MRHARHAIMHSPVASCRVLAVAQDAGQPTNDAPNSVQHDQGLLQAARGPDVGIDERRRHRQGRQVDLGRRALRPANSCLDRATGKMSDLPTVLKFDATGKLVKSFGAGLLIFPHGIHVDRDGNVWVTDGQDNAPRAGARRGAAAAARRRAAADARRRRPVRSVRARARRTGNQVFKFSPDGKVLLTLGKPGGAATPDYFYQPNDVITAPNGDIFVVRRPRRRQQPRPEVRQDRQVHQGVGQAGHRPRRIRSAARARVRFAAAGCSSAIATTTASRSSIRTASSSQEWKQFSRPSGIYIDKNDILYVADSESESVSRNHDGWKRGIRMGSVKDGKVIGFIPDPETRTRHGTSPARAPPKASRSTPPATSTARKSDRRR